MHALLSHVQYDGLAVGDHNRISGAVGKHRTGERRHIRDRAARGVGFVFTDNLETLLAAVLSAQGDRHVRRTPCFYHPAV